jgi:hypothetical protein
MQPVSWSTKIGVARNHQNKIIFSECSYQCRTDPTKAEHVQPEIAPCS